MYRAKPTHIYFACCSATATGTRDALCLTALLSRMCGRTSLFVPPSNLRERFDARPEERIRPRYNIAPGEDLAVVRNDAPDVIDLLEWGLLPDWVDDPAAFPMPINARAESLAEKRTFREAVDRRRCLVLADGFYEWPEERGHTQPYRIERTDGDPFAMAGLWERWTDGSRTRRTVTIVTTAAQGVVAPLHDRMPVILDPAVERTWIADGEPSAPTDLLDPAPPDAFHAYPISTAVNDPRNDSPDILTPVDAQTQTGLDEF